MPQQPPFALGSTNTQLNPLDEMAFRQWVQMNNVPFDPNTPGQNYDMRGYWQGLQQGNPMSRPTEINPNDSQPHYTDYFKNPNHPTFSDESQFAGPMAPQWINDPMGGDIHQLAGASGRILYDEQVPGGQIGSFQGLLGLLGKQAR